MPIVHGHTLDEVASACGDIERLCGRPSIVALGGMVPFLRGHMSASLFRYRRLDGSKAAGETFVADAIATCRRQFPSSHFHVLGIGSATTAIAALILGADSVDSLAWRRAAGFGTIFLSGLTERIVSKQDRVHNSRPRISRSDRGLLKVCECPICALHPRMNDRLAVLAGSYIPRAVHNVWTLRSEESELRTAVASGTLIEFSKSRISGRHRFRDVVREHLRIAPQTGVGAVDHLVCL
jgi:queuine/archaeosine tRNA-ribosyltransferase